MNWMNRANEILAGKRMTRDEALAFLKAGDDVLLEQLQGAYLLRRHFFGQGVQLHVIENAKSGLCTEDCAYCSQSAAADTEVEVYAIRPEERLLADARTAKAAGATRYCLVMSGRAPREEELDRICSVVRKIKGELDIQVCTSLGLLDQTQAARLAAAGVDRYNHNLESSQNFYPSICGTHTWQERVKTVSTARAAGMEICCGGLIGMGESDEDRVDLALSLRELDVQSIPVNFLDPRPGTPLEKCARMNPREALRVLAMFRFVHPDRELRIAGGREAVLRSMQPLSLYAANSMFTEGYLTTPGQGAQRDLDMLADGGFNVSTWGVA